MRIWPFLRDNGEEVSSAPEGNPREDQGDLFGMDCFFGSGWSVFGEVQFLWCFFFARIFLGGGFIFFYFHPYLGK